MKCQHCQKEFLTQRSVSRHSRTCVLNANRVTLLPWNKGKTKATDESLAKASEALSRRFKEGLKQNWSEESKEKLSILAKERGLGGYRPHPNKGVRYKDIWFDSKWEETITDDYTITTDKNAGSFGPITIASGVSVTLPTGSTWSIT